MNFALRLAKRISHYVSLLEIPTAFDPRRADPESHVVHRQAGQLRIPADVLDDAIEMLCVPNDAVEALVLPQSAGESEIVIDLASRTRLPRFEDPFQRISTVRSINVRQKAGNLLQPTILAPNPVSN